MNIGDTTTTTSTIEQQPTYNLFFDTPTENRDTKGFIFQHCTLTIESNNENKACLVIDPSPPSTTTTTASAAATAKEIIVLQNTIKNLTLVGKTIDVFFKDCNKLTITVDNMDPNGIDNIGKLFKKLCIYKKTNTLSGSGSILSATENTVIKGLYNIPYKPPSKPPPKPTTTTTTTTTTTPTTTTAAANSNGENDNNRLKIESKFNKSKDLPGFPTPTIKYSFTDFLTKKDIDIELKRKSPWDMSQQEKRIKYDSVDSNISAKQSERSISSRSTNTMPFPTPIKTRYGICNLGNSCYMSVVLQSMFGLTDLFRDIKNEKFKQYIPRDGVYNSVIKLYDKSNRFPKKKTSLLSSDIETGVDPSNFKDRVDKVCTYFQGFLQHDAHEFLVSLLDILEEELKNNITQMIKDEKVQLKIKDGKLQLSFNEKDKLNSDNESDENSSISDYDDENGASGSAIVNIKKASSTTTTSTSTSTSTTATTNCKDKEKEEKKQIKDFVEQICPITKHFKSTLINTFKCCNCHQISTSSEIFTDLSLDLPKSSDSQKKPTLSNLLETYFKEETIDRKCTHCRHTKSILTKHISKSSDVLAFHLKRFKMNSTSFLKNSVYILNSESIDIGSYMKPKYIEPIIDQSSDDSSISSSSSSSSIGSSISGNSSSSTSSIGSSNNIDIGDEILDFGMAYASASTTSETTTAIERNQQQQPKEKEEKEEKKSSKSQDDVEKPVIYSINTIVKHTGTLNSGHYVCYGNDKTSSKWTLYDDSDVKDVGQDQAINSNAYILFYTLKK
ncbi:hypothetical protein CYY_006945 [Polysphondylium violaceum]|uniref:USP domain-containing protein n=1 Tax=Polysphondylium violaceum TaxID=133409 RepID=A0A8J4PPB6_9MYCE|nr:hypothetical protein CYY_006945 [Polysphondylium violaceum]